MTLILVTQEKFNCAKILFEIKHCFATHRNDVEKISTLFLVRLRRDSKLPTQRPTKVAIHYQHKLNTLLDGLKENCIINQVDSTPYEQANYGITFLNPLIIIKGNDSFENVLDARHLKSKTDQSYKCWPLQPSVTQIARAIKNITMQLILCTHTHILH